MGTTVDTERATDVPAVLAVSSGIWLLLAGLGTLWSLLGLLIVLAFGGMVVPQVYLPALVLYVASGAVFLTGGALSLLLRRGRRPARMGLSLYVVLLPVLLLFHGGPPSGEVPWRDVMLSPAGAAGVLAVAATVLMWLPPANAYFARHAARPLEEPAGSVPPSGRIPRAVTAAAWILVVAGVVAALQAVLVLMLVVLAGNPAPALVLWLTLAAVAAADLACVRAVRHGRPFVRPVVAVIPLAGLALVVLAAVAGVSSPTAGSPAFAGGLGSAIILTVLSQGLPLIGGLVPAVLVWLPSARRHFRPLRDGFAGPTGP